MTEFIRRRGLSLAVVVLVTSAISLAQGSISYTVAFGALNGPIGFSLATLTEIGYGIRWAVVAVMTALWLLRKKRPLFVLVIVVNVFSTLALLMHTVFLTIVLAGLSLNTAGELLLDVVLMATSNILVFSVWYWLIDPPGIDEEAEDSGRWAFLFPQRADTIPGFEDWRPRYTDYLFTAFTTSFAFSPTDALPLTRIAKLLMALQAAISLVTLTGIAASAINILAGASTR